MISWRNTMRMAQRGISTHRVRSALTILGVVIGVTAIIVVMALGQGAEDFILKQIQGLGSRTIAVAPGREPTGPTDTSTLFLDSLKQKDVEALKKKGNVPYAEEVMPVVFGPGRFAYGNETYQGTVFGAGDAEIPGLAEKIFNLETEKGFFYTAADVRSKSSVVVLGGKVAEELFGEGIDPVGEKIRVNNRNFRVIGTLSSEGQSGFFNFDNMVMVPYTTAQEYIFGRNHFDRIIVTAASEEVIEQTEQDITLTLRNSHGITDPEKDDFFVESQASVLESVSSVTLTLTVLLTSVAAISLLVGGVGIMNIMLVSVTERTREIGLRKAVGATNRDIRRQFLLEAVMLTVAGGAIGVALGIGITAAMIWVINTYVGISLDFKLPIEAMVIGVGVSALVGMVFGLYPARQASMKSPIEALRYE